MELVLSKNALFEIIGKNFIFFKLTIVMKTFELVSCIRTQH